MELTLLQQNIINHFQKDFPLTTKPFQALADIFSCKEHDVLTAIKYLNEEGVLSRVGPVFDHKKAGASTLAAIAAPPEKLDKIAGIVNQFDQVNHNYAREHRYNLWFVVTAQDPMALAKTLEQIEQLTGLPILVFPMEASYHIDLGFKIKFSGEHSTSNVNEPDVIIPFDVNKQLDDVIALSKNSAELTHTQQQKLRKIVEKGLPLSVSPYADIAQQISLTEAQVQSQLFQWQESGLIRRFGLVVKHRKLGFNANAMVVWNIPDKHVDKVAGQLSSFDEVSLCYRRPRRGQEWPYNLFCMIHGKDRQVVLHQIESICQQLVQNNPTSVLGSHPIEKDILFSYKAYKQHGARYSKARKSTQTLERAHG